MEATIFFIISCEENVTLDKELISLSSNKKIEIINKDLIIVKEKNKIFMDLSNIDNILDKNIYLYKTKIKLKDLNTSSIYIKLLFLKKELISNNPIEIKYNNFNNFIYDISYVIDNYFDLFLFKIFKDLSFQFY